MNNTHDPITEKEEEWREAKKARSQEARLLNIPPEAIAAEFGSFNEDGGELGWRDFP